MGGWHSVMLGGTNEEATAELIMRLFELLGRLRNGGLQ